MFDWLDKEIALIKTRKFHRVDGPASAELRHAVEKCDLAFPQSYRDFVLRFGNAELYRYSHAYYLTIYAGPRELEGPKWERYLNIGSTWTSQVYFNDVLFAPGQESPVFEWFYNSMRKTADGFEEWLENRRKKFRKQFKKKQWEAIVKGPPPFTDHEHAIVEARKLFQMRVAGMAKNEDLRFEIYNGSKMRLPYLSVDIVGTLRPPNIGPLDGGVFLPVDSIGPGETKIVEHDCYKEHISPEETKVSVRSDPGPEDREWYWEFKKLEEALRRLPEDELD